MIPYQTKARKLPGVNYTAVRKHVMQAYNQIKKRTKRKPYVRSAYFKKQKVFLDFFWPHLLEKSFTDRTRRLRYFEAAIAVIQHSRNEPFSQENPHKQGEILHRFAGLTKGRELFYVQIKENKRSGAKHFMSCFPQE